MEDLSYYSFNVGSRAVVPSVGLCKLLNITPDAITQAFLTKTFGEEDLKKLAKTVYGTYKTKLPGRCTVVAKLHGGTVMYLLLESIYVESDNVIVIAGNVVNITDINSGIQFLKSKLEEHDIAIEANRKEAHFAYTMIKKFLRYFKWWGPIITTTAAIITLLHNWLYEW